MHLQLAATWAVDQPAPECRSEQAHAATLRRRRHHHCAAAGTCGSAVIEPPAAFPISTSVHAHSVMLTAAPVRSLGRALLPACARPRAQLGARPPAAPVRGSTFARSHAPRRQQACWVAGATPSGSGGGGGESGPAPAAALQQLVASPLYRIWLQLGVVLLLLMLIDAGFSGDWSRINVLTPDQEALLRQARRGRTLLGCHARCNPP